MMSIFNQNHPYIRQASYDTVQSRIHNTAGILGLEKDIRDKLGKPALQILLHFASPVKNKNQNTIEGYLVIHSSNQRLSKGDINIAPELNMDNAKSSAALRTLKTALWGLPYGGAQGGIIYDPSSLSEKEKFALLKAYQQALSDAFQHNQYRGQVPELAFAPDPEEPLSLSKIKTATAGHQPYYVEFSRIWTGMAILYGLELKKLLPSRATAAVYGFKGNALNTALYLYNQGIKIRAVSEGKFAFYSPYGIDIRNLVHYRNSKQGSIKDYPNAIPVSPNHIFSADVDVLLLGDGQAPLQPLQVSGINAGVVAETGDNLVSEEIDLLLSSKGITLFPDILLNIEPVLLNGIAGLQKKENGLWPEQELRNAFATLLQKKFADMEQVVISFKVPPRTAAHLIALKRTVEDQLPDLDFRC